MNFYIRHGNLTIDIENRRIADIQRGKPDENAIELDALDATFEIVHIANRKLHLDGLAITDLITWLHIERPATFNVEALRFYKLFRGSSDIYDVMRAIFRIVLGREHKAHGESAYFVGKVRDAYPAEFAELRTAMNCYIRRCNLTIVETAV